METGILLESGTNELEILEFRVGSNYYGINVAKIREILPYQVPTPIPNADARIEGIFMPRDEIISIVDLSRVMNLPAAQSTVGDMYIVTNFNNLNTAFHVQGVEGIHRVSWGDIIEPDSTINASGMGMATGIVRIEGRLIIILDFEKIVAEINPETGLKISDVEHMTGRSRVDSPILIAEDSPLLGKMLLDCLKRAGFANIDLTNNGKECWDKLSAYQEQGVLDQKVACVITDIEMPQMDGHHLTKLIKSDEQMMHIPVIIFSSLINDEMRKKGESLGADMQLSKPEIGQLVGAIDQVLQIENADGTSV
ncbi:MAG: chemotaxis protein CheV [Clostridium sp. 44_14]|jgi:two-component system chemotaxis response regulator CheV|uniref:chemotaxis protein n=1 Tax=Jutongia sp. TaxID=2944204 RepID=UPI00095BB3BF|nr:MAG: chemotaxis protein CheV [Clostridium sp. 44_14]